MSVGVDQISGALAFLHLEACLELAGPHCMCEGLSGFRLKNN
jgi:hypothetical protein